MCQLKLLVLFCLFCLSFSSSQGQHYAFSQYLRTPAWTNPAFIDQGSNIIGQLNYRGQSSSSDDQFNTSSFFLAYPFLRRGTKNTWGSLGLTLIHDNQTDILKLNAALLGFAYHLPMNQHHLRFGMQFGFHQQTVGNFSTGSQFNPISGFDPSLFTGEVFENSPLYYGMFSSGLTWQVLDNQQMPKTYLGISFSGLDFNVRSPLSESTTDNYKSPFNWVFLGGFRLFAHPQGLFSIQPNFRWISRQGTQYLQIGNTFQFHLKSKTASKNRQIKFSSWYAKDQAWIFGLELEEEKYYVGFSYDLLTNSLKSEVFANGAIELTLGIKFHSRKRKEKLDDSLQDVTDSTVVMREFQTEFRYDKKLKQFTPESEKKLKNLTELLQGSFKVKKIVIQYELNQGEIIAKQIFQALQDNLISKLPPKMKYMEDFSPQMQSEKDTNFIKIKILSN